jgi:predicted nucleic acid-binding protein
MNPPVFLDTGYILAAINTADKFHKRAQMAALSVKPPFITTEAVLIEIGNALSKRRWRTLGIATLARFQNASDIEIVPLERPLLVEAISLYSARADKEWGLTDCISFVVMQTHGLTQVLTTDRHFEQAGFQNLM